MGAVAGAGDACGVGVTGGVGATDCGTGSTGGVGATDCGTGSTGAVRGGGDGAGGGGGAFWAQTGAAISSEAVKRAVRNIMISSSIRFTNPPSHHAVPALPARFARSSVSA